jgi:hypothetical protein
LEQRKRQVPWTEREDALICKLRARDRDLQQIADELPHRTLIAVKRRFAHLIKTGRIASLRAAWTPAEDDLICSLRTKPERMSAEAIAGQLTNRTAAAVAQRIQQLRLEGRIDGYPVKPVAHRPWTVEEELLLVRLRSRDAKLHQIAAKLPHRTRRAVEARISTLLEAEELERTAYSPQSRRPWSAEEDALVAAMRAASITEPEMAKALGRSVPSVKSRIAQRVRRGELELVRPLVNSRRPHRRQPPTRRG